MNLRILIAPLAVAALAACSPSDPMARDPGEWVTWGGDYGFTRYSELDQINADNVDQLEIAWRWSALPLGSRPDYNLKATPIMVDGVLYTPTGVHQVVALDPATGEEIWRFSPEPEDIGGRSPTLSSRALAWWSDGDEMRLFHNTLDGRLISIDAETGEVDPEFGDGGYITLKEGLVDDREVAYVGSSSPAAVVGDVVIAQVVGEITPANKEATPGFIRGYDVHTGELVWTFHTIPQEGEFGNDTWEDEAWRYTGNTGVWSMMSVDPDLGYVYLPVESPSHDFYGGQRHGDGLFGESLVALDGRTGERVWHYQLVHHGIWDYDPPAAPILHDVVIDGVTIPAVTQLTKQGMSFVFNRETGEPIWPIEELEVPQSTVPGEQTSATQPFPTRPAPYSSLGYQEDELIDFTPELRAEALEIAQDYVRGPMYTPITVAEEGGTQGTWVYPGYGGGANWNGGAFDPETGMMFVPTRNTVMIASLSEPAEGSNWDYNRDATTTLAGPRGLPINRPPWAVITGTDMNAGEHVWSRSIGGAPDFVRNHPDLQGLDLDFDNMGQFAARPVPMVTKTLMFMGESGNLSGDPGGPMFRAYDKLTGDVVAELELPAKASGGPMTYMHEGRQYIVIAVAEAGYPAELIALALPDGSGGAGERDEAETELPPLEPIEASPEELAAGAETYATVCAECHGPSGEGVPNGGPALQGLDDLALIRRSIADGGIEMPPQRTKLTREQIAEVAKYLAVEFAVTSGG